MVFLKILITSEIHLLYYSFAPQSQKETGEARIRGLLFGSQREPDVVRNPGMGSLRAKWS